MSYIDPSDAPPPSRNLFRRSSTQSADSDDGSSSSESDTSSSSKDSEALQKEFDESMKQLQMLLTIVVMPFIGKWMGRKVAYWSELSTPHEAFIQE